MRRKRLLIELDAPIDWKRALLDLKRWGWTLKGVAAAINAPPSTLKRWWNDGSEPRYEYGRALLKLHAIVEKRSSDPARGGAGLQPFRSLSDQQEELSMGRAKPKPRKPGTEEMLHETAADAGATESNVDEAIALAQSGKARKVAKPKPVVQPSKVRGDPDRPKSAAVNSKAQMSYADAMKALAAGTLKRSVLTERGWVAVNREPPVQAKV